MAVKKSDIPIPEPCDAAWDDMHDRGDRRFCDHCIKDVHDLSALTRDEALTLLERRGEHLCVRYAHADGEVFFKDSTSPVWRLSRQLEGAKKLLAAAALIVPMLAACDPAQPAVTPEAVAPTAVTPISISADGASLEPGAGIAPTFGAQPEASVAEAVVHEMGEPPMAEDPEIAHEMGNERVEVTLGDVARVPDEARAIEEPEEPRDQVRHTAGKPAPDARHVKGKLADPLDE